MAFERESFDIGPPTGRRADSEAFENLNPIEIRAEAKSRLGRTVVKHKVAAGVGPWILNSPSPQLGQQTNHTIDDTAFAQSLCPKKDLVA